MSDDETTPVPEEFAIPTIDELEAMRQDYRLSMAEFSRRAGFERDRWGYITRNDVDPHLSTIRAYLDALQTTDPNGFRVERGRPPETGEAKTHDVLNARLDDHDGSLAAQLDRAAPDAIGGDPSPERDDDDE